VGPARWKHLLRPQDFVWLLLFSAMAAVHPQRHPAEIPLLISLALLQVLEPKIPFFESTWGNAVSILLKLLLGYLLIGFTGGLGSSYYLILLLPVVSAATSFGVVWSLLSTSAACLTYASFLMFIDWNRYWMDTDQKAELILRLTFLAVTGFLTNTLSEANREQSRKYRLVAEQLAAANQSVREAEAAMRRSERLAALGQLSAGLAHELRNPLGTIRASAEMLSGSLSSDNEVAREVAGFVLSEADRTNTLVSRFLDFARPLQLRFSNTDLGEVIDLAIAHLEQNSPKYDVHVYRNYSPEIGPFQMDADMLERVFYNLLLNAAQASPAGSVITVKTRPVDGFAEISVIDRGSGIDPKQIENIFNPFFTTKPEGVGLGLAIVSKIVDEHGGRMTVESEPGRGSTFHVHLPIRAKA